MHDDGQQRDIGKRKQRGLALVVRFTPMDGKTPRQADNGVNHARAEEQARVHLAKRRVFSNENGYRRRGDSDRQAVEIEVFKKFPVLGFYRGLALCFTQTRRGRRAFHSSHTLLK